MTNYRPATQDLIQYTIEVWQPYFINPMTEYEAEEVIARWTGFLNIAFQSLEVSLMNEG